ncbi:MAG: dihydrodipicolinate synthase family protein [Spirochaetaceae bacterium]|nr:MAG: dihydrodipicolinate synthase family protein [Spirochaetaceae bacterium]
MRTEFPGGVWPTMITPFTADNRIDFTALQPMADWYLRNGVSGLFAVCQSSAMFEMTLQERVELARASLRAVSGKVPVIASGHIADSLRDQVEESGRIIETGVDAFVFVTNRFARRDESDEVWFDNLQRVIGDLPSDVPFGLYECPYPYKRLLSPALIKKVASTGRFCFLKDTCSRVDQITAKLDAVRDTTLQFFNANAATLLTSLQLGAAGYSGVMANFQPDLYSWLCRHWRQQPELAEQLQSFLGTASVFEYQLYPVNAKYYQQLEGLPIELYCRRADQGLFTESQRLEIQQMRAVSAEYRSRIQAAAGHSG